MKTLHEIIFILFFILLLTLFFPSFYQADDVAKYWLGVTVAYTVLVTSTNPLCCVPVTTTPLI